MSSAETEMNCLVDPVAAGDSVPRKLNSPVINIVSPEHLEYGAKKSKPEAEDKFRLRWFSCTIIMLPSLLVVPLLILGLEKFNIVELSEDSMMTTCLHILYYLSAAWGLLFTISYFVMYRMPHEDRKRVPRNRNRNALGEERYEIELCMPSVTSMEPTVTSIDEAILLPVTSGQQVAGECPPSYADSMASK
ncbi:hypothetical protein HDE_11055 [Halotydeus destructor]|nr:hypothetical protein HDE_11055 [Halotydeus destructor]